jgi:hypothetical protein
MLRFAEEKDEKGEDKERGGVRRVKEEDKEECIKMSAGLIKRGGRGEGNRTTLIKNEIKFSSYIRKIRVIGCKVIYMTNSLLTVYGEIFAHFLIY